MVLFWKKDVDLLVENSSQNYIDAVINKGKEDNWRFTGFYGFPKTQNHGESWKQLRWLQTKSSLSWLCADDFNEITKSHEKLAGRLRPHQQMQDFHDVLDECGFHRFGLCGKQVHMAQEYLQ